NEIITKGEKPEQLSKEFVREWLIQNNFMGKPGQIIPEFSENLIIEISEKYISLYEKLTGEKFIKSEIDENEMFKILSASITDLIETN
ncbi:MAG: phosphoribosylaminoimidazolesuccinocarboxamide synthase, partial [Bacteroidetes bacterium]|nr:phosphoribosylaminoimidazolesuccinocarboxamide synthase [Bacteroidota bacterium]